MSEIFCVSHSSESKSVLITYDDRNLAEVVYADQPFTWLIEKILAAIRLYQQSPRKAGMPSIDASFEITGFTDEQKQKILASLSGGVSDHTIDQAA